MDKHIISMRHLCLKILLFCLLITIQGCSEKKDVINIAVASNFEKTLKQIKQKYLQQSDTDYTINIISASSGALANQLLNNAPFDLFLSADVEKPLFLQKQLNINNKPRIYAIGQLALWIPENNATNNNCLKHLNSIQTLAIANPKTAPYGHLAEKIINNANIKVAKIIQTANVTQAYLYTKDNLAEAGFVSYSMLEKHSLGCIQKFQDSQLSQSMLLINNKAKDFYQFILTENIQNFIKESGYNIQKSNILIH